MSKKTEYYYDVGDVIYQKYGILKINDQKRLLHKKGWTIKGYNVICQVCNYPFDISESHLKEGCGCSVCSHHKVLKGYNDMWTTDPELAQLLLDPNDGYIYAAKSNKKVNWKCPYCNEPIYDKIIQAIHRQGLSCPKCGDGISFPNKFMYNILHQLQINFEVEKKFDWCTFTKYNSAKNTYGLYDFVIEDMKLIIEMDGGLGHGRKTYKNKISNAESEYKDRMKDQLAASHGYNVIRVSCDYEDISIRNEVCKTGVIEALSTIFDLNNIDWNVIYSESLNSHVVKICELYNNGMTSKAIAEMTKLSWTVVLKYLKQGAENEFCDYISPIRFNKQYLINHGYNNMKTRQDLENAKCDFICNYYNEHPELSLEMIADRLDIGYITVWKFLKRGSELGYCAYQPEDTKFKKGYVPYNKKMS